MIKCPICNSCLAVVYTPELIRKLHCSFCNKWFFSIDNKKIEEIDENRQS